MQSASELRKLVTTTEASKTTIVEMIETINKSALPAPQRQAALAALSEAWIALAKGNEDTALQHVSKARLAVQRAKRWV